MTCEMPSSSIQRYEFDTTPFSRTILVPIDSISISAAREDGITIRVLSIVLVQS